MLVSLRHKRISSARGMTKAKPSYIRSDATFENISIALDLSSGGLNEVDSDLDSTFQIWYRKKGHTYWLMGAPGLRTHPNLYIFSGPVNRNVWAASCLWCTPNTTYQVKVEFEDPDTNAYSWVFDVTTKAYPTAGPDSIWCQPTGSGGSGTQADPYKGAGSLQTAINAASAGDTIVAAADASNKYNPVSFGTKSGTLGNPITIRAATARGAIIDATGSIGIDLGTTSGECKHIIIDGFLIENSPNYALRSQNGSFITMKNCKTTGCNYGFAAYRSNGYDRDCWITNNEFIGTNSPWPSSTPANAHGVQMNGNNNVVSYNTISYFYDGIHNAANTTSANRVYSLDIHNNYVFSCFDDFIETDDAWHNIRVYENACFNSIAGISTQPVYGGPMYAIRNLTYNNSSTTYKLASNPAGIIIVNNSMGNNDSALTDKEPFANAIIKNNLVISNGEVHSWHDEGTQGGTIKEIDFNCYYSGSGYTDYVIGRWGETTQREGFTAIRANTPYEDNSVSDLPANLVTDWGGGYPNNSVEYYLADIDFRPKVGSVMRGNGVNIPGIFTVGLTPDIGAYQYGDSLPQYGKTW